MRVLLVGALLGVLLGLCSFWMLQSLDWITDPQRMIGSAVLGLGFAGLVWSFGFVRWIAMRFDRRARRTAEPDPYAYGEPEYDYEYEAMEPAVVEVELDDEPTGAEQTWVLPATDGPATPPPLQEDFGSFGGYDEDEEFDENTTQLISRAELRAFAQSLLDGKSAELPEEIAETEHVRAVGAAAPLSALEVEVLLGDAAEAVEQGRFNDALDLFTQVVEGADDVRAYLGRGRIYLDHSDYSRAMSDFTVAESRMPGAPEPLVAMGDLYFGRKDYAQAIEYFTLAIGQDPNNAMALTRRGMSQYYRKAYEAALDDLQNAARLNPDIPLLEHYLHRAQRRVKGHGTVPQDRRRR